MGRWSGDRSSGRVSIDTLKAIRGEYSERITAKVRSGGTVKAAPRYPEKSPKELKAQEGIER
jgi:hypothetical protein